MHPGEVKEIGRIDAGDRHFVAERIETHNPRKPRWRITEGFSRLGGSAVQLVCYCGSRGEALREIELRAAMRRQLDEMKAESRACGGRP